VTLAATNQIYVVETVDYSGNRAFEAVDMPRYQQLKAQTAARNRLIPKALDATREDWRARYAGISKAFPPDVADAESVTSLGLFTSEDAARAKIAEIAVRLEQRRDADAAKMSSAEKQIEALKDDVDRLGSAPPNTVTNRTVKIRADRLAIKVLKREIAEARERDARQEADLNEARAIFESKLAELVPAGPAD
jgi:DNA repair exonuclease SbcCD ATPase subunit